VLGDGADYGVRLRYVEEPEPLGTAGPIKFAADLLDDRFLVLNGDVLTDLELTAQIAHHEQAGAIATIALVPVEDPSAYGLVRLEPDGAVREFLEKPDPSEIDTNLINAGAYVLEREILDLIPAGRAVSIEREVFPLLTGGKLHGFVHEDAYWLDVGTPERYLQAGFDVLDERGEDVLIGANARIAEDATVGPLAVLADDVEIGAGASVERSVVLEGAVIEAGAKLRDAIVCARARIGEKAEISGDAVIGEGVEIEAQRVVGDGARIFPEVGERL
jgi:mannose-1-phosphate guanylyltransferase